MKIPAVARTARVALMSLTVLAILLLGMVGGVAWARPSQDDGGGTVPTEEAGASSPFVLPPQEEVAAGDCGLGPSADTAPTLTDPSLTRVLMPAPGSSQLLSATGVASFTAEQVLPNDLPASPVGYELLGCGIKTSGVTPGGLDVVLFRRGPFTCFPTPPGYNPYKIFYWDTTLVRWVGLVTLVDTDNNEACTSLRLPATLALFGVPVP
jgi:hypothetical protein